MTEQSYNLFWDLMRSGNSSTKAHEDFVTEALRAVLGEDPQLSRYLVMEVLKIEIETEESLEVRSQDKYTSHTVGECIVDLVIRNESLLVFCENKISATLNKYRIESGDMEETIDQIEKYDRAMSELPDSFPSDRYLIAIAQDPLKEPTDTLRYFKRSLLWWDVYRIIENYHPEVEDVPNHAVWLRKQFLDFMHLANLDPPRQLRQQKFVQDDAIRMLAEAIREAGGYQNVRRMSVEAGFRFMKDGQFFEVWFEKNTTLRAREIKVGGLVLPELGPSFWESDVNQQVLFLQDLIHDLSSLKHDENTPVSVEEALDQFKDRVTAEKILGDILKQFPQDPSTGKKKSKVKEISIIAGEITVRLAPYKWGEHVTLNTGAKLVFKARFLLKERLGIDEAQNERWPTEVKIPLSLLKESSNRESLIGVIKLL